jgi:hypothetical protein
MRTLRKAEDVWYWDARPFLMRVRQRIFRCGLEMPHISPEGYTYVWNVARLWEIWTTRRLSVPTRIALMWQASGPISLFDRMVIYPWGMRLARWTLSWQGRRWALYASVDATPHGATRWLFGAPREVRAQADRVIAQRIQEQQDHAAWLAALQTPQSPPP